ncbi:MAG: cob(I)yrinic acid a,c-diamide adenosyltransferase [Hyphomicrobiales bacterium]|nr:cob(I)yrinic acid a,c-diamide adenosyltransferase [Hyphomicrobiales bacterium]MBV9519811.1 cob(I)yrinic acid a,c-diamide adenosyltransferase [Hyphomicrobiales bacterium]
MVVLNRIYTRAGDKGKTRLATGAARLKSDLRVEAYGTIDETNASIGLARLHTKADAAFDAMLARIQNDLFDLGADLATPEPLHPKPGRSSLRILATQVARLENEIDALNERLAPLTSFVLPGGSPAAAALHVARTVCRRAERVIVALAQKEGESVGADAIKFINRLSDFLFVAARFANDMGAKDVLWVPGQNR